MISKHIKSSFQTQLITNLKILIKKSIFCQLKEGSFKKVKKDNLIYRTLLNMIVVVIKKSTLSILNLRILDYLVQMHAIFFKILHLQ